TNIKRQPTQQNSPTQSTSDVRQLNIKQYSRSYHTFAKSTLDISPQSTPGISLFYCVSYVTSLGYKTTMADPVTGLTEADRQVIIDTWEVVGNKEVMGDRAVELFIALFEAHPYMQNYFKDFNGMSVEELKTSPKLRTHASRTWRGLQQYMTTINDVPKLAGHITKIAQSHLPRGLGTLEMDRLATVFVDFMKVHCGAQWSDHAVAAWTQLFKVHNVVYKAEEDKRTASG
ncbi:hypothetical protein EGW08_021187, partial [Elysia chlorotica]